MATKLTAADLRVGNLLNWGDTLGTITQITYDGWIGLKYDTDKYRVLHIDMVKPIQLTEKWLIKFGFVANSVHDNYKLNEIEISTSFRVIATNERSGFWLVGTYEIGLSHIHQLQNLYYALTNTELTIKEDKQ